MTQWLDEGESDQKDLTSRMQAGTLALNCLFFTVVIIRTPQNSISNYLRPYIIPSSYFQFRPWVLSALASCSGDPSMDGCQEGSESRSLGAVGLCVRDLPIFVKRLERLESCWLRAKDHGMEPGTKPPKSSLELNSTLVAGSNGGDLHRVPK